MYQFILVLSLYLYLGNFPTCELLVYNSPLEYIIQSFSLSSYFQSSMDVHPLCIPHRFIEGVHTWAKARAL